MKEKQYWAYISKRKSNQVNKVNKKIEHNKVIFF